MMVRSRWVCEAERCFPIQNFYSPKVNTSEASFEMIVKGFCVEKKKPPKMCEL